MNDSLVTALKAVQGTDPTDLFARVSQIFLAIGKMDKDQVIAAYSALVLFGYNPGNFDRTSRAQLTQLKDACLNRMVGIVVESASTTKAEKLKLFRTVTQNDGKLKDL